MENDIASSSLPSRVKTIPYPRIKLQMENFVSENSELNGKRHTAHNLNGMHGNRKIKKNYDEKSDNPYRARVVQAYKNRKIFTVFGNYNTIRTALLNRGWIEKLAPARLRNLQSLSEHTLLEGAKRGNDYETAAISKLISHFPSFFIWQPKAARDISADVQPFRNRVRRSREVDFSTKVGLIGCAQRHHWYGEHEMNYPRFYCLDDHDEIPKFIEDFRITQCLGFLSFLCEASDFRPFVDSEQGTVPLSILNFAVEKIEEHLNELCHGFLDDPSVNIATNAEYSETDTQWQNFLTFSSMITKQWAKFKANDWELAGLMLKARPTLEMAKCQRPLMHLDGIRNLWILKPGYQCRGMGIVILNNHHSILDLIFKRPGSKYIAQKYIERPLLIYNTKFDIRQYFLLKISDMHVSIWMYKDCYLRFSSQEFSMEDLRESIHLTNNSVQKKYRNGHRDPRLPTNNMWSLTQFRLYLEGVCANKNAWMDIISPGFKENIISVVLSSLDETQLTPNAFEIYGCDFMLDEHLKPIIIEVNSTPDMSPSTEVTARICTAALQDVIKVVVDLPRDSKASTGNFELIYQIKYSKNSNVASDMEVIGTAAKLHPSPTEWKKTLYYRKKVARKNASNSANGSKSKLTKLPARSTKNGCKKNSLSPKNVVGTTQKV